MAHLKNVKLSDKGIKLHDRLDELFTMHAKALAQEGIDAAKAEQLDDMLTSLEAFWKSLQTRDLRR